MVVQHLFEQIQISLLQFGRDAIREAVAQPQDPEDTVSLLLRVLAISKPDAVVPVLEVIFVG